MTSREQDAPEPIEAGLSASGRGADEPKAIAAAQAEPRAFAPLYHHYVTPVYRYFVQQVRNRQDAEDLTATTFMKALAGLPQYQEQGNFPAWLFTIARRTLIDYRRQRHPAVDADSAVPQFVDPAPLPEIQLLNAERSRVLRRLIDQLPADQKEAIGLRFFVRLRTAEIARVLGRSDGAIRMLLHLAIIELRDCCLYEDLP